MSGENRPQSHSNRAMDISSGSDGTTAWSARNDRQLVIPGRQVSQHSEMPLVDHRHLRDPRGEGPGHMPQLQQHHDVFVGQMDQSAAGSSSSSSARVNTAPTNNVQIQIFPPLTMPTTAVATNPRSQPRCRRQEHEDEAGAHDDEEEEEKAPLTQGGPQHEQVVEMNTNFDWDSVCTPRRRWRVLSWFCPLIVLVGLPLVACYAIMYCWSGDSSMNGTTGQPAIGPLLVPFSESLFGIEEEGGADHDFHSQVGGYGGRQDIEFDTGAEYNDFINAVRIACACADVFVSDTDGGGKEKERNEVMLACGNLNGKGDVISYLFHFDELQARIQQVRDSVARGDPAPALLFEARRELTVAGRAGRAAAETHARARGEVGLIGWMWDYLVVRGHLSRIDLDREADEERVAGERERHWQETELRPVLVRVGRLVRDALERRAGYLDDLLRLVKGVKYTSDDSRGLVCRVDRFLSASVHRAVVEGRMGDKNQDHGRRRDGDQDGKMMDQAESLEKLLNEKALFHNACKQGERLVRSGDERSRSVIISIDRLKAAADRNKYLLARIEEWLGNEGDEADKAASGRLRDSKDNEPVPVITAQLSQIFKQVLDSLGEEV